MSIRSAFIGGLLIFGYTSAACANSCSNVVVLGTYDESGLTENDYGIYAWGTFRVAEEVNEDNQPMFNLAQISCEKQRDESGNDSLECKLTQASVSAQSGKPDTNNPNCDLDLSFSTYSMKELQRGVLTGIESSTALCINTMLTIDRNTKRVYRSFTKTKEADNMNKKHPGTCRLYPTQVLMNCTAYPRIRNDFKTPPPPPRYCDFSSSSDK
jgi:hypothetical protein